jgi:hypothetical protein
MADEIKNIVNSAFKGINEIVVIVICYIIAILLIVIGYKIAPTGLGGPELDLLVYIVTIVYSVVSIVLTFLKAQRGKEKWHPFFVHFIALGCLIAPLFIYS